MAAPKLTILAPRTVLPGRSAPVPASIDIDADGRIMSVRDGLTAVDGAPLMRIADNKVLLPGLVDSHVHLNQPGRTAWEGFATGTAAAVAGGVTTLIDMPLNSIPPTTTVANLEEKRAAARETGVSCDVGFWGGIIPGNAADLPKLIEAGVKGFKCFLINSGVDEFPQVNEDDLFKACDALEGTNALVMFHAEFEATPHAHDPPATADASQYSTFLSSRPQSLETDALKIILNLCRRYPNLRFHIVHLSASEALPALRAARAGTDGGAPIKNLTIETCFHYLVLRAEDIPPNATQFKCCPPIRDEKNRRAILDAVLDGTIQYIVSDHSPCTPELKKGDFMSAWGGVSGLGLGLPLIYTEVGGHVALPRIVDWLSGIQAQQVGLEKRKGAIEVGHDADFVIFDPEANVEVKQSELLFRNKVSPYVGKTLRGRVDATYIRGEKVYDASEGGVLCAGDKAKGELL